MQVLQGKGFQLPAGEAGEELLWYNLSILGRGHMIRTYRYRLYPNATQARELASTLETHRRLYNTLLDGKMLCWDTAKVDWSFAQQCRWITSKRFRDAWLAKVNVSSLQKTAKNLDKAFQAFFRRVKAGQAPGFPRFRNRDRFESFAFDMAGNGGGCKVVAGKLRLQHIGTIRVCWHRELPTGGRVKQAIIKRESDKWYVCFSIELPDTEATTLTEATGIDVGIESFLTTSDGCSEPNPRFLKTALPSLRRASRSTARKKKKGGSNRRKSVRKLRKIHLRVRNLRREHHHQTACKLIRRYGLIAVERLNIQGMVKNGRLSRAIIDAGWYGFVDILKGKAESAGVQVVEVDPRGTSQQCSRCGEEVRKDLSVRWHDCRCGLSIHRDHNAALNILARARQVRTEPAGLNVTDYRVRAPRSRRQLAMK